MKKVILITFLLITFINYAQDVKMKKGEILLDKEKIGSLEKIKIKGANNFYQVKDNSGNVIFNFKLISEESKLFHKLRRHNYFMIDCPTENDTIGIEKSTFYLGEKRIAKYLVKYNLLGKNGINTAKLQEVLKTTTSKPSFVLKKINKEEELLKNINYKVGRDLKAPIFVEKISSGTHASKINELGVPQTKYKIYQGADNDNKTHIGYAFLEFRGPTKPRPELIITNIKDSPIAHSDNFKLFTFSPFEEVEIKSRKRLDNPVEAIYQIVQALIDRDKI